MARLMMAGEVSDKLLKWFGNRKIRGTAILCRRMIRWNPLLDLESAEIEGAIYDIPISANKQGDNPWVIALKLDDLPRLIRLLSPRLAPEETKNDQQS